MTRRLVVALAFAILLLVPRAARACECDLIGHPCQAFWQIDAVFDGVATAIETVPRTLPGLPDQGFQQKLITFQVRTAWKRVSAGVVSVLTGMGGGDLCRSTDSTGRVHSEWS